VGEDTKCTKGRSRDELKGEIRACSTVRRKEYEVRQTTEKDTKKNGWCGWCGGRPGKGELATLKKRAGGERVYHDLGQKKR